jgi:hypothetical protein
MSTISSGSGIPAVIAASSEMPVTPPSINPLGSKKPFSPNAAEKIPITINTALFKKDEKGIFLNFFFTVPKLHPYRPAKQLHADRVFNLLK